MAAPRWRQVHHAALCDPWGVFSGFFFFRLMFFFVMRCLATTKAAARVALSLISTEVPGRRGAMPGL